MAEIFVKSLLANLLYPWWLIEPPSSWARDMPPTAAAAPRAPKLLVAAATTAACAHHTDRCACTFGYSPFDQVESVH